MPLIRITTSRVPHVVTRDAVLGELSKQASKLFGKPERWVMTCLDAVAAMTFGGSSAPAAYVEVKNIGPLDAALARRVSAVVTAEVAKLGIERDRIYIEMTAAEGERWGHAGATFADSAR